MALPRKRQGRRAHDNPGDPRPHQQVPERPAASAPRILPPGTLCTSLAPVRPSRTERRPRARPVTTTQVYAKIVDRPRQPLQFMADLLGQVA